MFWLHAPVSRCYWNEWGPLSVQQSGCTRLASARAQEVQYIKYVTRPGGRYRLYRFPENHLTRATIECQRCRPSWRLVFVRFPKVSSVIETISQAHFVSVSCCKTVPLKPSNNSSRLPQGCGPLRHGEGPPACRALIGCRAVIVFAALESRFHS